MCGASDVYCYYQPLKAYNEKGYTSYNYTTSNIRGDLLKFSIEASRTSNDAVLYVCDIRTMFYVKETIEETPLRNWSDSISVFSPQRIKGITSFLFTKDWEGWDIPSFYFDIVKYHSDYSALASPDQWTYVNTDNTNNLDKGFLQLIEHIPFDRPEIIDERGELTEQQTNVLNALLDYCDNEKLQVLFTVSPYVISESHWKIFNTCGDIIQERGYDFINFNNYYDEMGINFETDFYNVRHVNYLGAEKYTDYLMNYISDHYELPDHRGDEAYSIWDYDYNEYTSLQEHWIESVVSCVEEHLAAKEVGENLSKINDFSSWSESIQNSNFTVIVEKNQYQTYDTDDFAFHYMIGKWGIDVEQVNYIGVWDGEEKLFSTNGEDSNEGEIGVIGRSVPCIVSTGENPQISVNKTDYFHN